MTEAEGKGGFQVGQTAKAQRGLPCAVTPIRDMPPASIHILVSFVISAYQLYLVIQEPEICKLRCEARPDQAELVLPVFTSVTCKHHSGHDGIGPPGCLPPSTCDSCRLHCVDGDTRRDIS
jgi:hypothetical protein